MTLFLRTCKKDGTSYKGYKWNLKIGAVNVADDYNDRAECGGGLHGIKNGIGSAGYLDFSDGYIGVVFSADEYVDIDCEKSKCREARVEFVGELKLCADYIHNQTGLSGIICQVATAGDRGNATAGDRGTATAGDRGTATAGDWGTATAGDEGTATAGYWGTATAGDEGTIVIKYHYGNRYRLKVGYIGDDGLMPNTAYRLDDNNNFVEVGK